MEEWSDVLTQFSRWSRPAKVRPVHTTPFVWPVTKEFEAIRCIRLRRTNPILNNRQDEESDGQLGMEYKVDELNRTLSALFLAD